MEDARTEWNSSIVSLLRQILRWRLVWWCLWPRLQPTPCTLESAGDWWLALSPCTLPIPCTLLSARCRLQSRPEASSDQSSSKNLAQQWQSPRSDMWRSSKPSRVSSRPSSRRSWASSGSSKTEQVLTPQSWPEIGWKRTLEAEWSVSKLIWSGHPIART